MRQDRFLLRTRRQQRRALRSKKLLRWPAVAGGASFSMLPYAGLGLERRGDHDVAVARLLPPHFAAGACLVSGIVQGAECNPVERLVLGRHKCAIGPVHPYYTDELRFIRRHGNSPCAQPWSVS